MSNVKKMAKPELVVADGLTKMKKKARVKYADDNARLKALDDAFQRLATQARLENKVRTICTMECICAVTGIDKNYVHGYKTKDPEIKKKYKAFKKQVNDFIESFVSNKSGIPSRIQMYITEKEEALRKYAKMTLELKTVNASRNKYRDERSTALNKLINIEAVAHSHEGATNVETIGGKVPSLVISPDKDLMRNGENLSYDEDAKDAAWDKAYKTFEMLMNRNLAQTVYLLYGLPGSGKSEWIKDEKHLALGDGRHPIIIDACNLTFKERYQWYDRASSARNCKIFIVEFLVKYPEIIKRNAARIQGKWLEPRILATKRDKMLKNPIDPVNERRIDGIIYVRAWK